MIKEFPTLMFRLDVSGCCVSFLLDAQLLLQL